MKLIQFTDTHFIPPGKTLYGRDPSIALERCIADINQQHDDADLCVVTGDLTHWGEPEAFEHLKEHLSALKIPWRLLVGNHDVRDEFVKWFPDQVLDENGFVQSTEDYAPGRFIFLDTNEPGRHEGWYCETRLAWLDAQLKNTGEQDVFLFMHHPPFDIGIPSLVAESLENVICGYHLAIVRPDRDQLYSQFLTHYRGLQRRVKEAFCWV